MVLAAICAAIALGCAREKASAAPPPAPVRVAVATEQVVPVEIVATGTAQSSATATVRARVSGLIERVHFVEGQDVAAGQLLFTIDRRPFLTALRQARADLAKARAQRDNAVAEAQRYAALYAQGVASQETERTRRTQAAQAEADVKAGEAAVAKATLDLDYCTVRSPVRGKVGALLLREGNVVVADNTPLVVVNAFEPMFVAFAVPEKNLPALTEHAAAGPLRVRASPPEAREALAIGRLDFVDNAVDPATGTVRLRATFDNTDHKLWPGQFLTVVLELTARPRIVVPSAAVLQGQRGPYAYVVTPDGKAEMRALVVDEIGTERAVVANGLAAGDRVVTEGQPRIGPGATVRVIGDGADGGVSP